MVYVKLRFGPFEADLRTQELHKHGTRIKLPPQPFQVLVALALRSGELVTRQELQLILWPNDTAVEFDHGINSAVKRIREALLDSKEQPRYIETLQRRGYRFIAPVERISTSASPLPAEAPLNPNPDQPQQPLIRADEQQQQPPPLHPPQPDTLIEPTSPLPQEEVRPQPENDSSDASSDQPGFASEPRPDWIGKRIGRYVVTHRLGSGGMGEVYTARDSELGRSVAIKFLLLGLTGAAAAERFAAEAKAASALNHPNIVTIYEVVQTTSRLALVMEFVDGMSLRQLSGTPLPADRLLDLGEQIARALAAAHARGIVHCDIKPENLMLRSDGLVKVLDFGLARDLSLSASFSSRSSGTLRYMSPEQLQQQPPFAPSDIFSLGIVLYELATGVHPFAGSSLLESANALNREQPRAPSHFNSFLPPAFDDLILSMLAKQPDARPTAADVARTLESRFRLAAPPAPTAKPPQKAVTRKSRILLWGSIAALLVAAFTGLLVAHRHSALLPQSASSPPLVQLDLDVNAEVSQSAIAPDGSQLVLVKGNQLVLRRLNEPTLVPLPGTDGASFPFFSPDGRWVAFFADRKLRKVAVQGGEPVTLCDAESGRGGTWGDDGQIVAALRSTGGLFTLPSSGGTPRPLTTLTGEASGVTSHRWPQMLPGGKGILFTATIAGGAIGSLRILPPGGGPIKTVVENSPYGRFLAGGYLVYYQSGRLIAAPFDLNRFAIFGPSVVLADRVAADTTRGAIFEVSLSGTLIYRHGDDASNGPLVSMDSSGAVQEIAAENKMYLTPRLSPNGKQLAVAIAHGSGPNLWIVDLPSHSMKRATFETEPQLLPVWTPDGRFIVFRSGSFLAWVRSDGGGKVERLESLNLNPLPYSISRDGKWLAFAGDDSKTGLDLYIAPIQYLADGMRIGAPRTLLRQPGGQYAPAISPDGHWIAYASDESGRAEIYVMPLTADFTLGVGKWQVSDAGGIYPVWSRGVNQLFYRRGDRRVMRVDCEFKSSSFLPGNSSSWNRRQLAVGAGFPSFDVTADGSRVLGVFQPANSAAETSLRVLLNVNDELERRSETASRKTAP